MKILKAAYLLLLIVISTAVSSIVLANDYQIEKVKGNIYRFIDNRHRSVFLVADDGILITDPMNTSAARWLKTELQKRFNLPVRYVVYSHNHSDHIYWAEVFKSPETTFISHELAKQDIETTKADTVIPDVTFKQAKTISLGDQVVELRYHGPNDGRGSVSMLFKPEKVLFVVDWIVLGRMPWKKLWSYDIQGMINSTRDALNLDFDVFVGGHADIGAKSDVRRYLKYLEELYAAVIDGIHSGKTLERLKADIKLDEFSDLRNFYEWLPLNIEGVYERLMEESGMGWRPDID